MDVNFLTMLVFIDETGDHNLIKIDDQYPVFGLGALLIDEKEYKKLDKEIKKIKKEFFDDTKGDFILHSMDLKRPTKAKDKRNLITIDPKKRKELYLAFDNRIVTKINFKVICCYIRKKRMVDQYIFPIDPYYLSFENLLNRIIKHGGEMNFIYAEKRGNPMDIELLSEYEKLTKVGIHNFSADTLSKKTSLKLVSKKENMNGLQFIDLLLSSLIRKHMGKKLKMINCDLNPTLIEEKYACLPTFFPKTKQ